MEGKKRRREIDEEGGGGGGGDEVGGEGEKEEKMEDENIRDKEGQKVGGGGRAYIAYYETRFHRQVHLRAPTRPP